MPDAILKSNQRATQKSNRNSSPTSGTKRVTATAVSDWLRFVPMAKGANLAFIRANQKQQQ